MPRPVVFPPKIHVHKASGQARVRWAGRDFYLGAYGSEEARQKYAELLARITSGQVQTPATQTGKSASGALLVCDVINRFDRHARVYYSARGRERDQFVCALRPLDRLFGNLPAASFGADELRSLQQAMIDGSWMGEADRAHPRAPKSGGWSRGVVNARIKRVRTVWRWAEEKKLVPQGTWAGLCAVKPVRANRPGAREVERARTTTMAEVKRVCRHLTPALRAALLVQFWTGMRSCEVRIMRTGDMAGDRYTPRQHKTDYLGHLRVVVLGPRALAALRPWLEAARARGADAAVFPSPGCNRRGGKGRGEPYTRDGYCQAIRRAADAAGLPHFHAYLCRHATRMRVSRHGGDEAARAVLGQRHLSTTLGYGELDQALALDVQSRLG